MTNTLSIPVKIGCGFFQSRAVMCVRKVRLLTKSHKPLEFTQSDLSLDGFHGKIWIFSQRPSQADHIDITNVDSF